MQTAPRRGGHLLYCGAIHAHEVKGLHVARKLTRKTNGEKEGAQTQEPGAQREATPEEAAQQAGKTAQTAQDVQDGQGGHDMQSGQFGQPSFGAAPADQPSPESAPTTEEEAGTQAWTGTDAARAAVARAASSAVANAGVVVSAQPGGADDGRDTIRILIRDAKPPIPARALQAFTRTICALLLICVAIIGVPRLFGVYEFNVLTGSMTPTYPPGTLVFVQEKDPASIRPGEVVSYIMDEELNIITHRVVSNNYDDKTLTTRGDANVSNDAPILYQNVVGVVGFAIPYVGGVVDYLVNDDQGRIFGIGMLVCVLAITFLAEGICSALTKRAAKVVSPSNRPGRPGPSVEMEAVRNTRQLRRELARDEREKKAAQKAAHKEDARAQGSGGRDDAQGSGDAAPGAPAHTTTHPSSAEVRAGSAAARKRLKK